MSYEILYKRFLVKQNDGSLKPYMIVGSNNAFEMSGKRERTISELYKYKPLIQGQSLKNYLILFHKSLSDKYSGFEKGVPKG